MNKKEKNNRNKLKENKPKVYEKVIKFKEKSEKGEPITILHLQYDYSCNMHCNHCSIRRLQKRKNITKTISPNDVMYISEQAHRMGLARYVITGGEPLIFPDLEDIVKAINPELFYISCDSNGWDLSLDKAKYLKSIGIDRIQLSLDSFYEKEHDAFRNKLGSWLRAVQSIHNCQEANLDIFINTVCTKQRLYSEEFIKFLEFINKKNVGVYVSFAKPVGAWEYNFDILIDKNDLAYIKTLEKNYNVFTHLTSAYDIELGCPAGKNITSISNTGDIFPCQYFQCSFGNIFKEDLSILLTRCMKIKAFNKNTCLMADKTENFIEKYLVNGIYKTKNLPIHYTKLFSEEDFEY